MIQSLAILTSGGDAPGMNAAIRAAARTAADMGIKAYGVQGGYKGLMEGSYIELGPRQVGGILQLGGTVLGSARSLKFKEAEGRREAIANLEKAGIGGLVVIGGNGTQTGAQALVDMGFPVMGVASTIDNDLVGSDITLGVDTALNVALESIDRLKVTAASHRRAFIVEVMGRDCGYLALMAAIAGGAEAVAIPEVETHPEAIAKVLLEGWDRGKRNGIVVVAEGAKYDAAALLAWFEEKKADIGFELRAVTLGHVQRGGAPTASDRILGSELGARAAQELIRGNRGQLVGKIGGKLHLTPLSEVAGITKGPDLELMKLAESLAL
jgi:6-phosphofructokinase 1